MTTGSFCRNSCSTVCVGIVYLSKYIQAKKSLSWLQGLNVEGKTFNRKHLVLCNTKNTHFRCQNTSVRNILARKSWHFQNGLIINHTDVRKSRFEACVGCLAKLLLCILLASVVYDVLRFSFCWFKEIWINSCERICDFSCFNTFIWHKISSIDMLCNNELK